MCKSLQVPRRLIYLNSLSPSCPKRGSFFPLSLESTRKIRSCRSVFFSAKPPSITLMPTSRSKFLKTENLQNQALESNLLSLSSEETGPCLACDWQPLSSPSSTHSINIASDCWKLITVTDCVCEWVCVLYWASECVSSAQCGAVCSAACMSVLSFRRLLHFEGLTLQWQTNSGLTFTFYLIAPLLLCCVSSLHSGILLFAYLASTLHWAGQNRWLSPEESSRHICLI